MTGLIVRSRTIKKEDNVELARLPCPPEDAVLVTHKGCSDGAGCSILWKSVFGRDAEVKYVVAGQVERFVKEDPVWDSGRFIVFADVGFNVPKYADLCEKRGNVVMLDHHKTSLHMADRPWATIEMGACGTELLRRYLRLDEPCYVNMAASMDDYDRFIRQWPDSERLATLMTFLGQDEFVARFRHVRERGWREKGVVPFTPFELDALSVIEKRRDENIEWLLGRVIKLTLQTSDGKEWRVGYVITSEKNQSLLLDQLLKKNEDVEVACQIDLDKGSVSLRSHGDLDVSELAGHFGGGGHRNAAGHPMPSNLVKSAVIDEIHGGFIK